MITRISTDKLKYAVQYMNGGQPWLIAAFVHETDAQEICAVWNKSREIYFVTEIGETDNG
jgi:hypothetical protein